MKKIFCIISIFFVVCATILAHEHWILLDNFFPKHAGKTGIQIGGGHQFPTSEFALSDKIFHGASAHTPEGQLTIQTTRQGKTRSGYVELKQPGVVLFTFTLKRKRNKTIRYQGKTIAHIGISKQTKPANKLYQIGTGLEIIPLQYIHDTRKGDTLDLMVLYDGNPVVSPCTITPEGKRGLPVLADKNYKISLPVKYNGRYLITSYYKTMGCSLTFEIK